MKFKNLIADREAKAMKMANMVHRALRTSNNVSIKLSMSLLDKQIIPILLYGSAVWGLPDTHSLIYLEDQPESQNTRTAARDVLKAICGYDVPFSSARRVGKNQGHYRSIMIRLKNIQDKEMSSVTLVHTECRILGAIPRCILINSCRYIVKNHWMLVNMLVTLPFWVSWVGFQ